MDQDTLLAAMEFSRTRLLASLDGIEKSGQYVAKVLAWRPGPGRAHIAWQAMHCAATHDRYLNVRLQDKPAKDEAFCNSYGGGSTPSDTNIPTLAAIRAKLSETFEPFKAYIKSLTPHDLQRQITFPGGQSRSVGESILLLAWHEGHHQGQLHLT